MSIRFCPSDSACLILRPENPSHFRIRIRYYKRWLKANFYISVSRKGPSRQDCFFYFYLGLFIIVSRLGFIVLCSFWRQLVSESTALWQSKAIGSSVLRAFFARNACFARDELSSKQHKRCWRNVVDTARCCHRVIYAAVGRS